MEMVTLTFGVPSVPLSANEATGMHWAAKARRLTPWREAAFRAANREGVSGLPSSFVRVTIPFHVKRRRDPHNYTGTVVKAIVDGLVSACVWPDDTPEWVTVVDPILSVVDKTDKLVRVELWPVHTGAWRNE